MHSLRLAVLAAVLAAPPPADAARRVHAVWSVTRATDPVTGVTRCTVAALDRVGRDRFTRTGILYPLVELSSTFGLLVGVSSGGPVRLPTGDILWRVDDRPFRTLKAEDNPAADPGTAGGADPATAAMRDSLGQTGRLIAAMTATATMASGETARDMLAEMRAGRQLIYRSATAAPGFGLASPQAHAVGQIARGKLVPYMLDASFHAGLAECGIAETPAQE